MTTFGQRLRELRESRQMSQSDLARQFNLSQGTIAHYESGKRQPNHTLLTQMADHLGVTTDYLLGRTDSLSAHRSAPFQSIIKDSAPAATYLSEEKAAPICPANTQVWGENIRRYRQQQGQSVEQLAEKSGVPGEVISFLENSLTAVSLQTSVEKIARALGVAPRALSFRDGDGRFPLAHLPEDILPHITNPELAEHIRWAVAAWRRGITIEDLDLMAETYELWRSKRDNGGWSPARP